MTNTMESGYVKQHDLGVIFGRKTGNFPVAHRSSFSCVDISVRGVCVCVYAE